MCCCQGRREAEGGAKKKLGEDRTQERKGKSLDPKGRGLCFKTPVEDSQRARPGRLATWWSGMQREMTPPPPAHRTPEPPSWALFSGDVGHVPHLINLLPLSLSSLLWLRWLTMLVIFVW